MEYISTYGWAILVISIVVAALFYLGIFNPSVSAPPGSCRIIRSKTSASFAGTCNGKIPKYIAGFNGTNSQVRISNFTSLGMLPQNTGMTISVWFNINETQSTESASDAGIINTYGGCSYALRFESATTLNLSDNCNHGYSGGYIFQPHIWYHVAVAVNSGANPEETYYVNGVKVANGTSGTWISSKSWSPMCIGSLCSGGFFKGYLANLQLYNTSEPANFALALYKQGIGGQPSDLGHIVGWWPLNGDVIDYGGNSNNGNDHNIIYASFTGANYSQP